MAAGPENVFAKEATRWFILCEEMHYHPPDLPRTGRQKEKPCDLLWWPGLTVATPAGPVVWGRPGHAIEFKATLEPTVWKSEGTHGGRLKTHQEEFLLNMDLGLGRGWIVINFRGTLDARGDLAWREADLPATSHPLAATEAFELNRTFAMRARDFVATRTARETGKVTPLFLRAAAAVEIPLLRFGTKKDDWTWDFSALAPKAEAARKMFSVKTDK